MVGPAICVLTSSSGDSDPEEFALAQPRIDKEIREVLRIAYNAGSRDGPKDVQQGPCEFTVSLLPSSVLVQTSARVMARLLLWAAPKELKLSTEP